MSSLSPAPSSTAQDSLLDLDSLFLHPPQPCMGPPIPSPANPKPRHEPRDTLSWDKTCHSFQPEPFPQLLTTALLTRTGGRAGLPGQGTGLLNPQSPQHRPLTPANTPNPLVDLLDQNRATNVCFADLTLREKSIN